MGTSKKITRVGGDESSSNQSGSKGKTFVPTPESKGKATRLRVIAGILWFFAIVAQIIAIRLLLQTPQPENFMMWMIILIVVDLILAIIGSVLWKKSNRLDPASEKQKFRFFMQNQLGLVVAVIAFLPLIIFILTSKNLDGKQKGILGGIAGVALIIAGITGVDFNPPSIEQYTEQTNRVEDLMGINHVYWTKSGTKYHLFSDCHAINRDVTKEIFEGTVAQARELKNITELCKFCEDEAEERGIEEKTNEVLEEQLSE
ncbi:hypothetical protein OOZ15_04265 [Galbibacter sp. EGI 63066]|uniref:hypothetical protein n=1 Tax=Galbibacter sp. EGI 63066 TaxID=2993559 RepID=UPI002248FB62|nr:hypothetical protein [Galbibacter sp. EGI 63066]MCX2679147.1 hypothetical protein [Galbibacter sp. EGI 63066]